MNNKENIMLWRDRKSSGAGKEQDDFQPYLEAHLLKTAQPLGTAVICPGGGYAHRAPHEGAVVAEKFNELGLHAFVVQYRVAPYRFPAPQEDALRAIKIIRSRAAEWKVKPDKIAICGFSAGGHLAGSCGIFFDKVKADNGDNADSCSSRPDALILCYPVISSGPKGHQGSFINLFGPEAAPEHKEKHSLEKLVSKNTPPAFLWHTADDGGVPVENSLMLSTALRENEIPFELHVFPQGRHGLGLAPEQPNIAVWPELCLAWLKNMGW
jgi:acetyl esterase/lipase